MDKAYCLHCGKEQGIKHQEKSGLFDVLGEKIEATLTIAVCSECGEEVWEEVNERKNDGVLFDSYRNLKGLLSSERIKAIREKYGLSQTGFATLLGFGGKTITRYENGSIQDRSHDLFIRMMEDERFFEMVWNLQKSTMKDSDVQKVEKIHFSSRQKPSLVRPFEEIVR